jgi:hypothetical protein
VYFNLVYAPFGFADFATSWKDAPKFSSRVEELPTWIIRNGVKDDEQNAGTDFAAYDGTPAHNGNGAVSVGVAAANPHRYGLFEDNNSWPIAGTEDKDNAEIDAWMFAYKAASVPVIPATSNIGSAGRGKYGVYVKYDATHPNGVIVSDNTDADRDGIPNSEDDDIDGDGVPNGDDPDVDGDGILNGDDPDVDGDGIPNGDDPDVDGDGLLNGEDDDIDGDGIPNATDPDVDGDGIPNGSDPDIDGDGIPNSEDPDMDGDGISNGSDTDTDGDGDPDATDPDPDGSGGGGGGAATVTGVAISPTSFSVAKGASQQFNATVTGTNSPAQTVTWSVTGGTASTIDSDSGLLSVGAGETATSLTVRATSTADNTKSGTALVTVAAGDQVTGVALDQTTLAMSVDGQWGPNTATLTATVSPSTAANKTLTWSSSDDAEATVVKTGDFTALVTAKAMTDKVTITVTTVDGEWTAVCDVTVMDFIVY